MKIKILDQSDTKISFQLEGATTAFANALRRTMIAYVPTYAIDTVVFVQNSSILYDEIVAHRLGLIPLKTDLSADLLLSKKTQTVKFTLDKKGPCTVYSADLKTKDKVVKPVYEKMPIAMLGAGHSLTFEAEAILGIGKDHAKWQPTTVCYYTQLEGKKDTFIFTVETSGALPPEKVVKTASKILEQKAKDFESAMKEL
ncbi:MAG: DNA-directed RNA polymerase subunit D [archaeon]